MVEIKFCENNFAYGTEETVKKLQEECKESSVSVESCLGFCGDCTAGPYALVNDELIQADTAEELFEKIKNMI